MSVAVEMILRSSLVVGVGLSAVLLLRSQPAAVRHWVLAATLVLAGAQPALNSVAPAWSVPVLSPPMVLVDGPVFGGGVELDQLVVTTSSAAPSVDWAQVAIVVWIAGVLASLGTLAVGALWLSWLGSRARSAGEPWLAAERDVRQQMGLRWQVRVLITPHPALLVTWGLHSPVILLPEDADTWSSERVRLVLAHEMAHLRRGDWLTQLGAELIRSVNWFNPLFWLASAQLRRESEHACDDIVLESGIGGTSYASHLVDLARRFSIHGRTWLPAPSIARPSTLERRVRAMLNPHLNRRPVSVWRRVAIAVVLVAIALPIAAAARAQNAPGGTVSDPSGRPLADAAVRFAALAGEPVFDTRTDANGNFLFQDIPAGEYLLSVRSPGFSTQRQRIRLNGGAVTLTLKLPVGTLRETVTVRGPGVAADEARKVASAANYTAPACTPSEVGGKLTPPRKLRDVRPRYKAEWAGRNLKGSVLMQATIGLDGKVRNVESVAAGEADLEDEAIAAISQWEFSPTYLNCQPVEVRMFVTVAFETE